MPITFFFDIRSQQVCAKGSSTNRDIPEMRKMKFKTAIGLFCNDDALFGKAKTQPDTQNYSITVNIS